MIHIAFYVANEKIAGVDCRDILQGNPGIGGSEYAILSIATYLTANYSAWLTVDVFANAIDKLPHGLNVTQVKRFEELPAALDKSRTEILVLKHSGEVPREDSLRMFATHPVRIVMWAHNFMTRKELAYYAAHRSVSRIVTVSREQLDLYRDHCAFRKSVAIYNGFNLAAAQQPTPPLIPFKDRQPVVTYIGSLIPAKGFHVLAKAWPDVVHAIPAARLHVIGSGQLYDRNCKLGKLGVAEESYERMFAKYITDGNGSLLDSITFHGVLGIEKNNLLRITKVGVPNPSGNTETFGYTALELQAHGALVTTKKCPGYLETVFNGILYADSKDLAKTIVSLLKRNENNLDAFHRYAEEKFSFPVIAQQWHTLFGDIAAGTVRTAIAKPLNLGYRNKWLRELNRRLKAALPFGSVLPSVMFFENAVDQAKRRVLVLLKRKA
jgi:Glycosyltransferase